MRRIPALILAGVLLAGGAQAQEGGTPIKVITTLHEDGSKTVTKTDPDQRTSEAIMYDAADKLRQRTVYTLDEQNQPASGIVYDAKGRPVFKSTYKHDGANRITEQCDYGIDGKLLRRLVFEYGANNRVTKVRAFDASGTEIPPAGKSRPTPRR